MTPADRIRRDLRNLFGPDSVQERDLNEALEDTVTTQPDTDAPPTEESLDEVNALLDSFGIEYEVRGGGPAWIAFIPVLFVVALLLATR